MQYVYPYQTASGKDRYRVRISQKDPEGRLCTFDRKGFGSRNKAVRIAREVIASIRSGSFERDYGQGKRASGSVTPPELGEVLKAASLRGFIQEEMGGERKLPGEFQALVRRLGDPIEVYEAARFMEVASYPLSPVVAFRIDEAARTVELVVDRTQEYTRDEPPRGALSVADKLLTVHGWSIDLLLWYQTTALYRRNASQEFTADVRRTYYDTEREGLVKSPRALVRNTLLPRLARWGGEDVAASVNTGGFGPAILARCLRHALEALLVGGETKPTARAIAEELWEDAPLMLGQIFDEDEPWVLEPAAFLWHEESGTWMLFEHIGYLNGGPRDDWTITPEELLNAIGALRVQMDPGGDMDVETFAVDPDTGVEFRLQHAVDLLM